MFEASQEKLETSDMSSLRVYRSMKRSSKNAIIHQIVTGIVLVNPTSFTGLALKIYSDNNGQPGTLIATSTNTWDRSQLLLTHNYGIKWVYFNFDSVALRANVTYHYVLNGAANYTKSDSQYIGWYIGYPAGIYDDLAYTDKIRWYFGMGFVGRNF